MNLLSKIKISGSKDLLLLLILTIFKVPCYGQLLDKIRLGPGTGQDAMLWITENCPYAANENNGSINYNMVAAWTWNSLGGCGEGETKVYLQFPLDNKMYQKSFFESATLKLFDGEQVANQTTVGSNEMWVQRVTSAWDENIITWNNGVPTHTTADQVLIPAATISNQDYSVDITNLAKTWFCGKQPNNGIRLILNDNTVYKRVGLGSKESANPNIRPLLEVVYAPVNATISDDTICAGSKVLLTANVNGSKTYKYEWTSLPQGFTSSSAVNTIAPAQTTKYMVRVEDNGCFVYDTVTVVVIPSPKITEGFISPLPVTVNKEVSFRASVTGGNKYQWTFDPPSGNTSTAEEPTYSFSLSGNHSVRLIVSDTISGCTDTFWMNLNVLKNKVTRIDLPNAFTPNRDNINDKFQIIMPDDVEDYSLVVFNRWGEKLFKSVEPANYWDGTYRGKVCPQGVYFYILEYFYETRELVSGTITIIE